VSSRKNTLAKPADSAEPSSSKSRSAKSQERNEANARWRTLVALVLGLLPFTACDAPQALPREFGDVARQLATSIADQGVWEQITANIDAEVIEPGIESSAGVRYFAQVKLTGTSGRVGLRGKGAGDGKGLSDEARAAIIDLGRDPKYKSALIELARQAAAQSASASTQPTQP
jgi:hypothetical protein